MPNPTNQNVEFQTRDHNNISYLLLNAILLVSFCLPQISNSISSKQSPPISSKDFDHMTKIDQSGCGNCAFAYYA